MITIKSLLMKCSKFKGYPTEFKKKSIIDIFCGAKGSGDSGPFHIKPKVHGEEEEMSEDEQRESRLPGYTADDDPVLGRPKSRKGKAPRR